MISLHCCVIFTLLFAVTETETGFIRKIIKRAAQDESNDTCGSKLIARKHGSSFTSPGYPGEYPKDADCTWRIRTESGNQISISFISLDVEEERKCQYDYLSIYDGPDSTTWPKVGQYCGRTPPAPFISNREYIFVVFHSDSSDSWGGFQIEFHAVGDFGGESGNGVGEVESYVDIVESDIDIDGKHSEDSGEGGDSSSSFSASSENSSEEVTDEPGTDNAGGEQAMSNDKDTESGTAEEDGCNQIWHAARHGNITSPAYPGLYPSDADCKIEINAPPNHWINLTFHFFDVEDNQCMFDYVTILNSMEEDADPIGIYCGHDVPAVIQSSTGQLILKFISDAADEKGGFYASFVSYYDPTGHSNGDGDEDGQQTKQADGNHNQLKFVTQMKVIVDLQVGDPVQQECRVNKEAATVSWYKDNEVLSGDDGVFVIDNGHTLFIPSMEERHEGDYVCRAYLPGKTPVVAVVSLQIADYPVYVDSSVNEDLLKFETVPVDANIIDGKDHIFTCSTSDENYILQWSKDGRQLTYTPRIYKIFASNLLVSDVRLHDGGMYSCVLYSKQTGEKLGEASANLTIISSLDMSGVCGTVSAPEATEDQSRREEGSRSSRITNGQKALKGSSPWMARLWNRDELKYFCGGSLLNYRWVVTATHCITESRSRVEQIKVRLGDHDTLHIGQEEMEFGVLRIKIYKRLNPGSYDGDIALLELDRRVPEFTNYVSPICLPTVQAMDKLLLPGKQARVTGWGQIIDGGAYPQFLREVNVPIVSEISCRESDEDATDNMVCAGYFQAAQGDSCHGDSGGPLGQEDDGKWYLTGIVSYGEGCDTEGKYGFYTKVINFIDWITETMES